MLLPPTVVNFQGWLKGYFETVGNQPVTVKELDMDYGFFDDFETQDKFYNLEGRHYFINLNLLDLMTSQAMDMWGDRFIEWCTEKSISKH